LEERAKIGSVLLRDGGESSFELDHSMSRTWRNRKYSTESSAWRM
jgi:hypothetical protein